MRILRHIAAATLLAIGLAYSAAAQVPAPKRVASPSGAPPQAVRLFVREAKTFALGGAIGSIVVVDPEPVTAEAIDGTILRLTGVKLGETLVIVTTPRGRMTIAVEVVAPPVEETAARPVEETSAQRRPESGSYTLSFMPALTGTHSTIQQRFDFTRNLGAGRTLRFSGDLLKFFDRTANGPTSGHLPSFGINRITLGVTSDAGTLDILDSTLALSPLSLSGYTMRGYHLVASDQSPLAGLDVFAGLARPSFSFSSGSQGRIVGALVPVAKSDEWRLRAGAIAISPSKENPTTLRTGGTIFQIDGLFTPSKDTRFFGEIEYSNGALSGGAQLDLRRTAFDISAGFSRLEARSPLISIGAQGAGRTLVTGIFAWHPGGRLNTTVSYMRTVQTAVQPAAEATAAKTADGSPEPRATAALANERLQVSATVRVTKDSQLGFRFMNQRLDVLSGTASKPFRLDTQSYGVSHSIRFGDHWRNTFEILATSSREAGGAGVERGVDIREELRRTWKSGAMSAFFRYTNNTQSLVGLLIRRPSLLPPALRAEYDQDPVRFLAANRDLLEDLFPGVALPYRRNSDFGFRLQTKVSLLNVSSVTSYRVGGRGLADTGGLTQQIGATIRLDAANSIQVSASHLFAAKGAPNVSTFSVSYTYRFGASAEDGFQIGRLFGLDRSNIRGRVFLDLNLNGEDDPDEPGVAGVDVVLDGGRTETTDGKGYFEYTVAGRGTHTVALRSDALGVRYRASSAAEVRLSSEPRKTADVSFGVTNFGSIAGRVYNDLLLAGSSGQPLNSPSLAGVRVRLHKGEPGGEAAAEHVTDSSGNYQFSNLSPATYTVEVDPATIPLDFRIPERTSWFVTVAPLDSIFADIPIAAERAIVGTVFGDKNGNGTFDESVDEPVAGALVTTGAGEVRSDARGRYVLRHLPAGAVELRVSSPSGGGMTVVTVTLGADPVVRRGVDVALPEEMRPPQS